jgi:hypothetical protein
MKYTEAKAKALLLTATRQIDHVIFESNGCNHVAMAKHWSGNIIETVKYEAEKTEEIKPEPKKTVKSRSNINKVEDKPEEI